MSLHGHLAKFFRRQQRYCHLCLQAAAAFMYVLKHFTCLENTTSTVEEISRKSANNEIINGT